MKFSKADLEVRPYDTANYLKTEEEMESYLKDVIQDGDPDEIVVALRNIARAKGMKVTTEKAGLGEKTLFKALKPGSKPRFETILKIFQALDIDLTPSFKRI